MPSLSLSFYPLIITHHTPFLPSLSTSTFPQLLLPNFPFPPLSASFFCCCCSLPTSAYLLCDDSELYSMWEEQTSTQFFLLSYGRICIRPNSPCTLFYSIETAFEKCFRCRFRGERTHKRPTKLK